LVLHKMHSVSNRQLDRTATGIIPDAVSDGEEEEEVCQNSYPVVVTHVVMVSVGVAVQSVLITVFVP
jgi:hypothetical protein